MANDGKDSVYACPICGNYFTSRNIVLRHMKKHFPDGKKYLCSTCGKDFYRKDKFEEHLQTHNYPCSQCNVSFKLQEHLLKHKSLKHDGFKCPVCDRVFKNKFSWKRHVNTHLRKNDEKKKKSNEKTVHSSASASASASTSTSTTTTTFISSTEDNTPQHDQQERKRIRLVAEPDMIIRSFECTTCGAEFQTVDSLRNHVVKLKHTTEKNALQEEYFFSQQQQQQQVKNMGKKATSEGENFKPFDTGVGEETALGGALKVVKFHAVGNQMYDYTIFLSGIRDDIITYITRECRNRQGGGVKWHTVMTVQFIKMTNPPGGSDEEPEITISEAYLRSKAQVTLSGSSDEMLQDSLDQVCHELAVSCMNYRYNEGTGWKVHEVNDLKLHLGQYKPLKGSQYIELPSYVQHTKGVVNIQNKDEKCFLWSVLAHLFPKEKNPQRVSKYKPHQNVLNMDGITYPVTINDVVKFEKLNSTLSVNVFGVEEDMRYYYPLYISKRQSPEREHINLLLIEKDGKSHYCLIKDLSKMLYNENKHKGRTHFCSNCLHGFTTKALCTKHSELCLNNEALTIEMPTEEDKFMQFRQVKKMLKVPFVVYADFECILVPMPSDINKSDKQEEKDEGGKRKKMNLHRPCGYSYLLVSDVEGDLPSDIVTYSGENVLEHFFTEMLTLGDKLMTRLKTKKEIVMTEENLEHYRTTDVCHICEDLIKDPEQKVRDHCHLTGKYRGPAHSRCNLNYRLPKFIPVLFHNLEGYDSHLLMQELGKYKDKRVTCIPKNMEKYISFSLGPLRFLDSLNFMNESLARLVNNLAANGDEHFHQIKRHFPNPEERALMLRKGVYPYEWMDCASKMLHKSLPPKENFYSTLTMENISDVDYEHAQKVWDTFHMNSMKDYHDLYLQTDVLLLADCFESFRKKCLEFYKLDPAHFYTTPGLSWTAALKMTGITLELLTDIDMHLMVEKGVRGGVSTIVTRYCKANNKYMPEGQYNPNEESVYMLDLDANNLYGWAMSQPLPTHSFLWVTEEDKLEELHKKILQLKPDADEGYILEVDLEIPLDLHDHFNEYAPAPEHMSVKKDMLSPFSTYCLEKLNMNHTTGHKLIPNLYNKEKYIIHYRTLQCYMMLGLKLTKIHRAIQFGQIAWLKEYIDFNTEQRKLAKNNFEKNFFKLMNNSVFGKTIENLRNRTHVELVHKQERFIKLMSKPEVDSFQRFNEDLAAVRLKKKSLKMNRPNYAGMVILDLAKLLMYDFYYNVLKRRYGPKLHLLFTDTDSLCVSIQTQDVYNDMLGMQSHLDCSDYPVDHFLHNTKNKKVLGKFKDEMNGQLIYEYVGLRAKMYSILWSQGTVKTCKGINRAVNKLVLKHNMYKDCLMQTDYRVDSMVRIGSEAHILYTYKGNKISLSPFDDKRYVLDDKISTLAYGHYQIDKS